ncbi:MAG: efflux RND transporter periplasmic adaptor subunit [Burkholderiaceae bacterium]|nr:efflux RND transporter periplasmic adaptor subunit [Roseateles sp.]MBV8469317.1 efflux RND transporter periplasmic adaptor subunit [Burkholderiaceae bacterium]
MTKRMLIMLAAVLALVAALAFGFYLHIQKLIASSPKPGAQTVTSTKAALQDWQPQLVSVGSLNPVRGVDVTTEIAGLVRTVNFKSGQDVKAGELLVQLNADSDLAQLHSAEAAAELAEVVLQRDKAQLVAKAISQAQLDSDTADLKAKRAQVAQQKATVEKKTIRAPFSGKLGITSVMPGQYLNPGDKIVTLQNLNTVYVDFNLPQQNVAALKVGQAVDVDIEGTAGTTVSGKISSINPKVDSNTRTAQAQATLDNSKHALLPGMFANVRVNVGDKGRFLTLPQTAITYNPYGSTVFVLKPADQADADGKKPLVAQQVFVTPGNTRGDQVAILKGLQEGQEVVTSGQIKLKNGTPVVVDNTIVPANSPDPKPQEH